jgi:hypothetical protein
VEDGVDQGEVGEGLGEVAQMLAAVRVDLLAVELERPGERQQLGAQLVGEPMLADLAQRRDQPEGADRERALLAAEPVVGLFHLVPQHEPVDGELLADCHHRGPDARVVGRQEAEQRSQEQRRVERRPAVVLSQDPPLVDTVVEDVVLDLLCGQLPLGRLAGVAVHSGELGAAVDGHPAHDLR